MGEIDFAIGKPVLLMMMTTFRSFLKTLTKFSDVAARKSGAERVLCMQALNSLAEAVSKPARWKQVPWLP